MDNGYYDPSLPYDDYVPDGYATAPPYIEQEDDFDNDAANFPNDLSYSN